MSRQKKIFLTILDGWGHAETWGGNAIALAETPTMDMLSKNFPGTLIEASGKAVGLPYNEPGNSEVGHQNLGSGQAIIQDLSAIDETIENKTFFDNPVLTKIFEEVKAANRNLHIIGLLSDAGIHAHIDHLLALLEMASKFKVKNVYIHVITDGRDSAPNSSPEFVRKLKDKIDQLSLGTIASVAGRYYAMDRDSNWDRTKKYYDVITGSAKPRNCDINKAIAETYANGITDEFVEPILLTLDGAIRDNDSVIFFNYRSDRMRQIARSLIKSSFTDFPRQFTPKNLTVGTFASYQEGLNARLIFNFKKILDPLATILADHKLTQLHAAETEKYAHVTYFFNGGREAPFVGEDRILVPSPDVKTYDLQPEMSAREITGKILHKIDEQAFDFVVLNFANTDMVGHTGNFNATVQAVQIVDACLGKIIKQLSDQYTFLVTADHGNAEQMINPLTAQPDTEHTTNLVPFILVDEQFKHAKLRAGGKLCDVAPTVLSLFNLKKTHAVTGESLIIL